MARAKRGFQQKAYQQRDGREARRKKEGADREDERDREQREFQKFLCELGWYKKGQQVMYCTSCRVYSQCLESDIGGVRMK